MTDEWRKKASEVEMLRCQITGVALAVIDLSDQRGIKFPAIDQLRDFCKQYEVATEEMKRAEARHDSVGA